VNDRKKPATGAAKRGARMAAMAAGVTGTYLGYFAQSLFLGERARKRKLDETNTRAARRITKELGGLRGPAMKLGQALSLQAGVLPDEMLMELASLQAGAPPMHPSLVKAQVKSSLGRLPDELFRSFDNVPFAAASLGQVHHAVTRSGQPVVVKVQYPGIREAIAGDFKWFRTFNRGTQLSRMVPPPIVDELEAQISAEADYYRETEHLSFFARALRPLGYVCVPEPLPHLSSDRVLTMSRVEGNHIERYLQSKPSQRERDLVGERLLELFYFQILRLGTFHSDPHWGNYLFKPEGGIGMVDFGSVKRLEPRFVSNLRAVFLYPGDRDAGEFTELMAERYGMFGRKMTRRTRSALVRFSKEFYGKVYPPEEEREQQAIDFADPAIMKSYLSLSSDLLVARAALPEYAMLARSETGLYLTLHRLKARVRTSWLVRGQMTEPAGPSRAGENARGRD
jgi:predicted unusual protein kinase regulating ubiquinone biosynthesis (AarF/ABC1/UbiB family)